MSKILSDSEIASCVNTGDIRIRNLEDDLVTYQDIKFSDSQTFGKDGKIQPSSLDLSIGKMFIPTSDESPKRTEPRIEYELNPGQTVVVETLEEIKLNGNICGLGFPIASISSNGILMTNPGHVDPGYSGHLSVTLINMGRVPILLRRRKPIISLLFFVLDTEVGRNFSQRRNGKIDKKDYDSMLQNLALDFGNYTERMSVAASKAVDDKALAFKNEVDTIKNKFNLGVGIFTVAATIIGALIGYYTTVYGYAKTSTVEALEARIDEVEDNRKISLIEEDLSIIRSAICDLDEEKELCKNEN